MYGFFKDFENLEELFIISFKNKWCKEELIFKRLPWLKMVLKILIITIMNQN